MSAFDHPFLFLRHPNGDSVENLADMKAAGFAGVFCNLDHPPEAWEAVIRPRAASLGMFCGPWWHTRDESGYAPHRLEEIVRVADRWDSPLIVNSEKEIDGSGDEITGQIAEEVGNRDAAISMEAWLFNPPSVDWTPVAHLPMLLQIFPQESSAAGDPWGCKEHAHACGIRCVYFTFGSYAGVGADSYVLTAPYSVYTADDCSGDFNAWRPRADAFPGCLDETPDDGASPGVELIGSQHGISALADVFRAQWPDKTGKPDPNDHTTWKAIDKWERSQLILARDHDYWIEHYG